MSQLKVFSYLSADKAAVYRRVMECFVLAKERYQLHLRSRGRGPGAGKSRWRASRRR